jgi:hypothetical protein
MQRVPLLPHRTLNTWHLFLRKPPCPHRIYNEEFLVFNDKPEEILLRTSVSSAASGLQLLNCINAPGFTGVVEQETVTVPF